MLSQEYTGEGAANYSETSMERIARRRRERGLIGRIADNLQRIYLDWKVSGRNHNYSYTANRLSLASNMKAAFVKAGITQEALDPN